MSKVKSHLRKNKKGGVHRVKEHARKHFSMLEKHHASLSKQHSLLSDHYKKLQKSLQPVYDSSDMTAFS